MNRPLGALYLASLPYHRFAPVATMKTSRGLRDLCDYLPNGVEDGHGDREVNQDGRHVESDREEVTMFVGVDVHKHSLCVCYYRSTKQFR